MKKYGFFYTSIIFIVTALNMFAVIILLFPFLAQEVQDISTTLYVTIYLNHVQFFSISCSVLISIPLTYVLLKKSSTIKIQLITICMQLFILACLIVVVYYNLDYLNELMSRPIYE